MIVDDLIPINTLSELFRIGGAGAVIVYMVMWLLKRGDSLQRDNILDLRKQRDEWRERAERAESSERELHREIARLRAALSDEDFIP